MRAGSYCQANWEHSSMYLEDVAESVHGHFRSLKLSLDVKPVSSLTVMAMGEYVRSSGDTA